MLYYNLTIYGLAVAGFSYLTGHYTGEKMSEVNQRVWTIVSTLVGAMVVLSIS